MRGGAALLFGALAGCAAAEAPSDGGPSERPPPAGEIALDAGAARKDAAPLDAGVPIPDAAIEDAAPPPDAGVLDSGPPDPCSAETLLAERAGFGRNAGGGDPTRVYHVTTLDADSTGRGDSGSLRRALESDEPWWIRFEVDGTIVFPRDIEVRSNKTIDGRGRDVTFDGTLSVEAHDVIIADVRMYNDLTPSCGQSGDVVRLRGPGGAQPADFSTRDIWLHHVELFNGGDGLLDLRGATNVTVSWTHFHTHKKGLLMWKDSNDEDTPGMHVTMHHNFFERISLRGPQFLFGKLHYVNNFQLEWFYYGAGCLGGGECFSESNVFQPRERCLACVDPSPCGDMEWLPDFSQAFVNEWATNGLGKIRSSGDLLLGGATVAVRAPNQVFDPAAFYVFTAEPATPALAERIRREAGPRTNLVCP